jgi:hypothetical protein
MLGGEGARGVGVGQDWLTGILSAVFVAWSSTKCLLVLIKYVYSLNISTHLGLTVVIEVPWTSCILRK